MQIFHDGYCISLLDNTTTVDDYAQRTEPNDAFLSQKSPLKCDCTSKMMWEPRWQHTLPSVWLYEINKAPSAAHSLYHVKKTFLLSMIDIICLPASVTDLIKN